MDKRRFNLIPNRFLVCLNTWSKYIACYVCQKKGWMKLNLGNKYTLACELTVNTFTSAATSPAPEWVCLVWGSNMMKGQDELDSTWQCWEFTCSHRHDNKCKTALSSFSIFDLHMCSAANLRDRGRWDKRTNCEKKIVGTDWQQKEIQVKSHVSNLWMNWN